MNPLEYSVVIATFERPEELRATLSSILLQTRLPEQTIVIDSSRDNNTLDLVKTFTSRLPLIYERATVPSAAQQRNQGARLATAPLLGFMDDDIVLTPDTCAALCEVFDRDEMEAVGGVAARIEGLRHPVPKGLLWWYYRMQAGYADRTYGGQLFGPAINCLPSYSESSGDLIPAHWLNSTCVLYRRSLFLLELFPRFNGYSFMEDVHLSARIGKTHKLFFHATASCEHRDAPSSWKRDAKALARMRIQNQRLVAREILDFSGPLFEFKLLLHRLFASISILRRRDKNWWPALVGTWT
jgi:GT2 family glycosyltransferase